MTKLSEHDLHSISGIRKNLSARNIRLETLSNTDSQNPYFEEAKRIILASKANLSGWISSKPVSADDLELVASIHHALQEGKSDGTMKQITLEDFHHSNKKSISFIGRDPSGTHDFLLMALPSKAFEAMNDFVQQEVKYANISEKVELCIENDWSELAETEGPPHRIICSPMLFAGRSKDEIKAILTHEVAHIRFQHIHEKRTQLEKMTREGASDTHMNKTINGISRIQELEADAYVVQRGYAKHLVAAIAKIPSESFHGANQNENLQHDMESSRENHTSDHPPIVQRIARLLLLKEAQNGSLHDPKMKEIASDVRLADLLLPACMMPSIVPRNAGQTPRNH